MLADAFCDYAWIDWIVPEDGRFERLTSLFKTDLDLVAVPHGSVWTARCPTDGHLVGAIAALRPDRPVPPDVWASAIDQQAAALGSHMLVAEEAERTLEDVRPSEPVLVVATLGVVADHRRRGLARRLLNCALGLADALAADAYLETSDEKNVALYGAAGFSTLAHRRVPGGGPQVWAMRRPTRSLSSVGSVREFGS